MLFSEAKGYQKILDILSQIKRLLGKKENHPLKSEVLIEVFKQIDLEQQWRVRLYGSYWDFHYFIINPVVQRSNLEITEHKLLYGDVTDDKDFSIDKLLICSKITKWLTPKKGNEEQIEHLRDTELLIYIPPSSEIIQIIQGVTAK